MIIIYVKYINRKRFITWTAEVPDTAVSTTQSPHKLPLAVPLCAKTATVVSPSGAACATASKGKSGNPAGPAAKARRVATTSSYNSSGSVATASELEANSEEHAAHALNIPRRIWIGVTLPRCPRTGRILDESFDRSLRTTDQGTLVAKHPRKIIFAREPQAKLSERCCALQSGRRIKGSKACQSEKREGKPNKPDQAS